MPEQHRAARSPLRALLKALAVVAAGLAMAALLIMALAKNVPNDHGQPSTGVKSSATKASPQPMIKPPLSPAAAPLTTVPQCTDRDLGHHVTYDLRYTQFTRTGGYTLFVNGAVHLMGDRPAMEVGDQVSRIARQRVTGGVILTWRLTAPLNVKCARATLWHGHSPTFYTEASDAVTHSHPERDLTVLLRTGADVLSIDVELVND